MIMIAKMLNMITPSAVADISVLTIANLDLRLVLFTLENLTIC